MGHVWTAPAVQEESDYQRSVRVQPCIRPVVAQEDYLHCDAAAVAAGPDVIRGSVPNKSTRSFFALAQTGFPIDGLDRFASTSSSPLQFVNAHTQPHSSLARLLTPLPRAKAPDRCRPWPATPMPCAPFCWPAQPPRP